MTDEWQSRELAELFEFSSGKSIKPGGKGPYPVFGSNGLIGGSERSLFEVGIIIGRVGAYCGSVAISVSKFWASDNTIVAQPKDGVDLQFGYYLLSSAKLNRHAGGAAQPLLTQATLKPLRVKVPSLPIQQRIASILGAYDDLIEVNRRRIAVLEEMARRLFEEWFVHERVPFAQSPNFVELPLGEVAEVQWGDTNTTKAAYIAQGYRAYSASGPDGFMDHYDHEGPGIVLSAIGAQCGKVWLADGQWSCIKNTIVIKARDQRSTNRILYLLFIRENVWPKRGAAQPFISQGDARKMRIRLPSYIVQAKFDELVGPLLNQCRVLDLTNNKLVQARDLLLPRLISGEVSVVKAERELEAVA